jgi:hypothetical protein
MFELSAWAVVGCLFLTNMNDASQTSPIAAVTGFSMPITQTLEPTNREATEDPFPFTEPSVYGLSDFVRSALDNGPSKNALKQISKIELLKDTRNMRHEFLVLSVDNEEEGLYLCFERRQKKDVKSWEDRAVFAWNLFQAEALDILTFHEPGSEMDVEIKNFAKASECHLFLRKAKHHS